MEQPAVANLARSQENMASPQEASLPASNRKGSLSFPLPAFLAQPHSFQPPQANPRSLQRRKEDLGKL